MYMFSGQHSNESPSLPFLTPAPSRSATPPEPRAPQVRLLLLAAMAGEHILLIGPPGTAKSEVGRRLNSLVDGSYFERLLTRFSVPEVGTGEGWMETEKGQAGTGARGLRDEGKG
jgi:MoxR-like ATPase